MAPMLAPWTLLSGLFCHLDYHTQDSCRLYLQDFVILDCNILKSVSNVDVDGLWPVSQMEFRLTITKIWWQLSKTLVNSLNKRWWKIWLLLLYHKINMGYSTYTPRSLDWNHDNHVSLIPSTCPLRHMPFLNEMSSSPPHENFVLSCFSLSSVVCITVYPKKYAHGFSFAVLCCGYTLTDFPISIRLTSLALWQSNDCPSASKATLMNMDKYFMWIHYEGLHNHNKAKHNKTVCIFLGIYCIWTDWGSATNLIFHVVARRILGLGLLSKIHVEFHVS